MGRDLWIIPSFDESLYYVSYWDSTIIVGTYFRLTQYSLKSGGRVFASTA